MSTDVRQIIAKWSYKYFRDFDEVPPQNEQLTFAKALLVCANGDGKIAPEERDWVIGFTATKGASEETLEYLENYKATESLEEVLAASPTIFQTSKGNIIYDAIQACAADGEYAEEEKVLVRKAAAILGISENEVKQLEELYQEEKNLFKKKIQLMFPKGKPQFNIDS